MTYSDLLPEEVILLAVEFVGRGLEVPQEIREYLGPGLMREIEHPETNQHDSQSNEGPSS